MAKHIMGNSPDIVWCYKLAVFQPGVRSGATIKAESATRTRPHPNPAIQFIIINSACRRYETDNILLNPFGDMYFTYLSARLQNRLLRDQLVTFPLCEPTPLLSSYHTNHFGF